MRHARVADAAFANDRFAVVMCERAPIPIPTEFKIASEKVRLFRSTKAAVRVRVQYRRQRRRAALGRADQIESWIGDRDPTVFRLERFESLRVVDRIADHRVGVAKIF